MSNMCLAFLAGMALATAVFMLVAFIAPSLA